ncbi:hypothetical protein PYCCODRAFT_2254 [Trametes coccinea BRFM310]|uniref:Uncharacterized protein n=1 Tax=Trametes coccinea (strain BRFM310) TaxID=1353009 RepID=A0A1Y2J4H2_TRAC3|nr:hypothetical protein PYCCODRAFT_2254 [Trametes coccinea BRFM310]
MHTNTTWQQIYRLIARLRVADYSLPACEYLLPWSPHSNGAPKAHPTCFSLAIDVPARLRPWPRTTTHPSRRAATTSGWQPPPTPTGRSSRIAGLLRGGLFNGGELRPPGRMARPTGNTTPVPATYVLVSVQRYLSPSQTAASPSSTAASPSPTAGPQCRITPSCLADPSATANRRSSPTLLPPPVRHEDSETSSSALPHTRRRALRASHHPLLIVRCTL